MVTISLEGASIALGGRTVLHVESARFTPNALIGVIGPNGAGKSTLVRAMLGLARPCQGRISVNGRDLTTLGAKEIAQTLAYLPQGQTLHWPLTVERLVALGRLPHLGPLSRVGPADEAAVEEAMIRADVAHLRHRNATELSGGERARSMLARALAAGAPGLIADEPLMSLDPGHQLDVMALLAGEVAGGKLVITVLHDLTMAARYCDRLIMLHEGRIVADGTPAAVLTPGLLARVYGVDARIEGSEARPIVTLLGHRRD